MGEQHADLICWKMQGPLRAIPCLIAVRQTAALGRVQSSLPLALPFTSKLASFWMGLGSLGSRRGEKGQAYPYLPSDIPPYTSADDGTWSSKPLTHE